MKSWGMFGFSCVCRWLSDAARASSEIMFTRLGLQTAILRISLMTLSFDLGMAKTYKITFFAIIIYKAAVAIR